MKKIVYPKSLEQIKDLSNLIDGFIIGIENLSVNTGLNIKKEEIDKYISLGKEIFVSLNKNMFNSDLKDLEDVLIALNNKKINGVFFYDLSVLNICSRLNLNIPLVWSQEHLTNNYLTCNYYEEKGIKLVNLSGEITLKEIIEIRKKTKLELIVPIFGYLPMFNSKRHIVNNYLETYNFDKKNNLYYMEKENKRYPLWDDYLGTTAYSGNILCGIDEYDILNENGINYVTFNSFNIDDEIFKKVLERFNGNNSIRIDNLLPNIDTGFLYKETIYRVKKVDVDV